MLYDKYVHTGSELAYKVHIYYKSFYAENEKIGIIINQVSLASEKINKLRYELKKYELSISNLKKKIKYLGQSKKRFDDEIKSLTFSSQKLTQNKT